MSDALGLSEVGGGLTGKLRVPIVVLLTAFLTAGSFTRDPHNTLACCLGIAIAVPAMWLGGTAGARWETVWMFVAAAGVVLVAGGRGSSIAWFGLCVIACSAVPCAGPRLGGVVVAGLVSLILYKLLDDGFQAGWLPWLGGLTISTAGGALYRHELELMHRLKEAQADLAERSKVEERARIARDLHDVIAHSLTVSLLHVTAARLAVEHDPSDAARSLAEAERLGRESLDEVRSIVGLMRQSGGGEDPEFAPTPGLDGIADLVERFRSAGVDITLQRAAEVNGNVPATVGTTAYRITQEALTNAAKHAPGAMVTVALNAPAGDRLELCVDSAAAAASRPGSGSGLASMRERAEAVGGRLSAAPCELESGPGWRVRAELPIGGGRWRN